MHKKVFQALAFFRDYGIDHAQSGNKHCVTGWVQIHCPFCPGSRDYHLGFHLGTGAWNCWRCGTHGLWDVIKALIGLNPQRIAETIERYQGSPGKGKRARKRRSSAKTIPWPPGIVPDIPIKAKKYLKSRKFNPGHLTKTWDLQFTGPTGPYKFRILAPIYHRGHLVSYQGRDYTGKQELRYKACSKDTESIDHQSLLYGSWLWDGPDIVVVEGIADAWRMGPGAVATFGISYTPSQINRLVRYKRLWLLFDDDPQAQVQADKLAWSLRELNPAIDIHIVELEGGDPGDMDQETADKLMQEWLKRKPRPGK